MWHPLRPTIASVSTSGQVFIWSTHHTESWSAFAPDFKELEENEEYEEREDEFDAVDVTKVEQKKEDEEAEDVDIMTIEKIGAFSSDSENELFYLPTVPERDPEADADFEGGGASGGATPGSDRKEKGRGAGGAAAKRKGKGKGGGAKRAKTQAAKAKKGAVRSPTAACMHASASRLSELVVGRRHARSARLRPPGRARASEGWLSRACVYRCRTADQQQRLIHAAIASQSPTSRGSASGSRSPSSSPRRRAAPARPWTPWRRQRAHALS